LLGENRIVVHSASGIIAARRATSPPARRDLLDCSGELLRRSPGSDLGGEPP
jgi:hypothetical protein